MIKQYFKQALRLLMENKLLSVISILGTALAICMIMVIVILYVVNTEGFKPEVNREHTYYFADTRAKAKADGKSIAYSYAGLPFVRECYYPLECAEVVTATIRSDWGKQSVITMDGLKSYNGKVMQTDPAFWRLFDFDFTGGSPFTSATFDSGLREAVVSKSVARTLFGSEQAVGKEFKIDFVVYRVCGVVADVSRFADRAWADIWVPYTSVGGFDGSGCEGITGNFQCAVLLKEGYTRDDLREEVMTRIKQYNSNLLECQADILNQPYSQVQRWIFSLNTGKGANVYSTYMRYGVILFILLFIPALNLSSITFSRMRKRIAELGVRRAFGATKRNIIGQVLLENLALTLIGGLLGLCFSYVAMWMLRDWLLVTTLGEAGLSMNMLNGYVFGAAFFFCLMMNLMSAGIPAWRVSRANITDSINS